VSQAVYVYISREDRVPGHISVPEDGDEVSLCNVGVFKLPDMAVNPRGFY
jgi:hypothetical protein